MAGSQDERSSAIPASPRKERRRIGPALLLGVVGLVLGIPFGIMAGALLAALVYCRGEGLPAGESCGMASIVFSLLGAPIGAIVGAGIGVFVGLRRPRTRGGVHDGAVAPAPRAHKEAPPDAWLAAVGGIAIAYALSGPWTTATVHSMDLLPALDASGVSGGPERMAFLTALTLITGGVLRVLRPVSPLPPCFSSAGRLLPSWRSAWSCWNTSACPIASSRGSAACIGSPWWAPL